jgi:GGDEF domain-containing protein
VEEGDLRIAVTVSLGGTVFGNAATSSPEQMVARADSALYEAKAAGRDHLFVTQP